MTIWISAFVVLVIVPTVAVVAAARLVKPRLEADPGILGRAVLFFGLPLTIGLAVTAFLISVKARPYSESNTVAIETRITDHLASDHHWINFETPDPTVIFQVSSSFYSVFSYDIFVRDQDDPERYYSLIVDRDMYRLATGQITFEEIGFLDRVDLLTFRLFNENNLVWVYAMRSAGETYLELDDANRVRVRQKRLALFFAVPVFLTGFAFDVLIVAGFLTRASGPSATASGQPRKR